MEKSLLASLKSAVKNWWVSLVLGILYILFAFILICSPGASYIALSITLGIFCFVGGLYYIVTAIADRKVLNGWGWFVTLGILELFIGLLLIFNPQISMVVIPFLIAFWLIFTGFSIIALSIDMQRLAVKGWAWYLVLGILGVLFSLIILWNPFAGAVFAVSLVAFSFFIAGVFRITLAFELHRVRSNYSEIAEKFEKLVDDNKEN